MKKTKRLWALLLAMVMALGLISTAFAAPTIDSGRKASLSLYKYDITAASADGAWDAASYVSTGVQDDAVTDKLAQYAIQGVEFTYLRVADIAMNNELVNGQRQVGVLYGFAEDTILQAIGLTTADAYKSESGIRYYTSDKLNKAMSDALTANATTVKNALEAAVRNGGKAMPETDENGHSKVSGLEQGLYLVVETRVPEDVTSTCNPFFVSLPMTTIDGKDWNYDVTVYPKNQTGNPTLEKTVREDKNSTGKNGGTGDIADGYAHTATASVGDVVDYQIISTLPTITSKATSLTTYTFADTLSKGICYNKNDVVIEFFRDAGCTDQITAWNEDSGKFSVSYDDAANAMTIGMTETGLAEINESESVYTDSVKRGYSDCTMRIIYAATLTADAQLGDTDNPNEVVLTWKRTNTGYFDTLQDCCHVYTYGVDVLKQFSDGKGDLTNVSFLLHNDTDGYYLTAELVDGVYYVTGHEAKENKATVFVPNGEGHIRVMGLEDDTYTLTETATDKGYVLLKDGIEIIITAAESESACETCGAKLLTASGSVNGDAVDMESGNAIVPLTVINNPGFDLPKTGGYGTWVLTWKRTNTGYFDTLQDCCHVYTYGVDVLKQFSDGKGDLTNVSFLLHNDTDGYYLTAELVDGVYYVTGHEAKENKATVFVPNGEGHIRVMGLEDDTYTLTETATDKGYVLLKDGIEIIITAAESESACETCGAKLLTASGSVNGDAVDMESGNAIVPLTVINNPGFDLPKTGGYGTWMFTVGGCMLLGVAAFIVVRGRKHNRNDQ